MCGLRGQFRRAKLSAVDGLGGTVYIFCHQQSGGGGGGGGGGTFRGGPIEV